MSPPPAVVICLCAAWCHLCERYAAVLESVVARLARAHPELQARWLDIEDEADLLGDVDVVTFPTIVFVDAGGGPRFAGPVQPQPEALERLLAALLAAPHGVGGPGVDADIEAFVARLRAGR
jgi:thioredoxin-like negative regulator of GroEL